MGKYLSAPAPKCRAMIGRGEMKRRIDYESKMVLPQELLSYFRKAEEAIREDKYERDKIFLHLSTLKYDCMKWFSDHETIMDAQP
jgi:hypothetical protein